MALYSISKKDCVLLRIFLCTANATIDSLEICSLHNQRVLRVNSSRGEGAQRQSTVDFSKLVIAPGCIIRLRMRIVMAFFFPHQENTIELFSF